MAGSMRGGRVCPRAAPSATSAERAEQAAQGGIDHELAQKGLRVDGADPAGSVRVLRVDQQEGVALQVVRGIRLDHVGEQSGVRAQPGGQGRSGRLGFLGDLRVDDGHQHAVVLRERLGHCPAGLFPGQRVGKQQRGVRGHAQAGGAGQQAEHSEQGADGHDAEATACAEFDEARQKGAHCAGDGHGACLVRAVGPGRLGGSDSGEYVRFGPAPRAGCALAVTFCWLVWLWGHRRRKQSFFEKKDQKAFIPNACLQSGLVLQQTYVQNLNRPACGRQSKSFLVLFFEKGLLPCLPNAPPQKHPHPPATGALP